jgi:PPOX class probable FMN-dependent enzyme
MVDLATPTIEAVITTTEELRTLFGEPSERAVKKQQSSLDEYCRAIIAASPFALVGTSGTSGRCDVSPRGDGPGFALVLDDHTIALPERPGNKRTDSLTNILENPHVGVLFIVPGKTETLRVNGRARIARDVWLLERLAFQGKRPLVAIVIVIEECFGHCAKAFLRSHLWEPETWPAADALPSLAEMIVAQVKPEGMTVADVERAHAEAYTRLY